LVPCYKKSDCIAPGCLIILVKTMIAVNVKGK
jgi:hypothetical protein